MPIRSLLITMALLTSSSLALNLQGAEPAPAGLSVSISFSPAASNPDAYSCNAEIIDLSTGNTLAKPQIIGVKGEASKAQIGDDQSALVLDVLVNKAGTNGTYTVTFSKAGKVVGIQKGSISIR